MYNLLINGKSKNGVVRTVPAAAKKKADNTRLQALLCLFVSHKASMDTMNHHAVMLVAEAKSASPVCLIGR